MSRENIEKSLAHAKEMINNIKDDIPSKEAAIEALAQNVYISSCSPQQSIEKREQLFSSLNDLIKDIPSTAAYHGDVLAQQMSKREEVEKALDAAIKKDPTEVTILNDIRSNTIKSKNEAEKLEKLSKQCATKLMEEPSLKSEEKALAKEKEDLKYSRNPGRRP